jgi:KaiC/GvpD/RAD55 family RecA-like ATPase
MLYGGLPLGSSIVLTAPPCDEKNLILARFVERNLSLGHKCIFISTSLDRVQALLPKYRANLSVIICNPHAEALAASYPDVARLPSVDSLTALNLEYDKAMAKIGSGVGAVLCLEILDDVLLAHHGETRRWLMDILGRSKARQITTLATFNQAMHPPQESQAVLETFDGHIDLYEAEVQVRPKLIQVKKLGGRQFLDTEVRVDKDKI